ncbi:MAG: transcriptional regulator [Nitrosopumilaceae archaeon]
MFEKFKKNLEKFRELASEESQGTQGDVMVKDMEYESEKLEQIEPTQPNESQSKPVEQIKIPERVEQFGMGQPTDDIGIKSLMDKRTKLEEAIDYVGLMIKNLKDKRTKLEKNIEDESVDIKNLKEKLIKVGQYIDEENQGIKNLAQKRAEVEKEADDVGTMINNLSEKLKTIDHVVDEEGNRIKNFKESRSKTEGTLS